MVSHNKHRVYHSRALSHFHLAICIRRVAEDQKVANVPADLHNVFHDLLDAPDDTLQQCAGIEEHFDSGLDHHHMDDRHLLL